MSQQGQASDDQAIRELIQTWMQASQAGDYATVLGLMTDDVIFLTPGRPPMTKEMFAAAQKSLDGFQMVAKSEVQEVTVAGDWASTWTSLSISITPPGATTPIRRTGHTLSILKKSDGRWRLHRDANLLATVVES